MSATDRITVGEPLPRLASVVAGGSYEVALTWAEGARVGRSDVVDLAPIFLTYKVFRPLREDAALFRAVRLGEGGGPSSGRTTRTSTSAPTAWRSWPRKR